MTNLEKVAREICAVSWGDEEEDPEKSKELFEHAFAYHREHWFRAAKAAIEAIRVPSEGMRLAGAPTMNNMGPEYAEACWRAMIDAILDGAE